MGGAVPWPLGVPGDKGWGQALKPLALAPPPQGLPEGGPPLPRAPPPPRGPPCPALGKCISYSVCNVGPSPGRRAGLGCELHRLLQAGRAGREGPVPRERASEQEARAGEGHRCPWADAQRWAHAAHLPALLLCRPLPSTKVSAARGWGPCCAPPQVPASPLAEAIHEETGCGWGRPMSPWPRRGGVAGCPDGPVLGRRRRAVLTWTWAAGAGEGRARVLPSRPLGSSRCGDEAGAGSRGTAL